MAAFAAAHRPLLATLSPSVTAALIAAGVSVATTLATKLWLERRSHREQLEVDYQFDQRKALRGLVGRYHGRLLEQATNWHYRMGNLYKNVGEGWLDRDGTYGMPAYYFNSTVYRFLALQAHAQLFADEQVYIDARFVEGRDVELVKFVQAFGWAVSDAELFDGLEIAGKAYDRVEARDHITTDRLRAICEAFLADGAVPSFRAFELRIQADLAAGTSELTRAFELFDGVSPVEDRLRWDRIICLHLLTIPFIRMFGYDWLPTPPVDVENAVKRIRHRQIAHALGTRWLPALGLADLSAFDDVKLQLARRASGELPCAYPEPADP